MLEKYMKLLDINFITCSIQLRYRAPGPRIDPSPTFDNKITKA